MKILKINLIAALLIFTISVSGQVKQYQAAAPESSINYHLSHTFHEVDAVSKESICIIEADVAQKIIQKVSVKVDVSTFNSGNSNRDSHAMETIESIYYPDAWFVSDGIAKDGDSLKVAGKLTFHGVTKSIVISVFPVWSDKKLTISGSFSISLTAFKVERPSLMMIPVKDELKFKLTQVFNF
jgi:polyisoprenoid-binding protein YceI